VPKLTKKEYLAMAEKVGVEKLKAIENASGVDTGLLDKIEQPKKSEVKPKDSKVSVNVDCTKEELLKAMKEQGCSLGDYKIVKYGEPDYVLCGHKETQEQIEQITGLYGQLTDYLFKSFDIVLKIGEILFNLKEKYIERGKFGLWMEQNLPFSKRTGQRYMQIYLFREELDKKGIKSITGAYREINGDPLDDEDIEVDDGTDTKRKWEMVAASVEVDNVKLPKKKLKGLQETVPITPETVERMEQGHWPFNVKYAKIVATIPSSAEHKSLLSRYVIAADNLLVPGGKLIFVRRKQ